VLFRMVTDPRLRGPKTVMPVVPPNQVLFVNSQSVRTAETLLTMSPVWFSVKTQSEILKPDVFPSAFSITEEIGSRNPGMTLFVKVQLSTLALP